MIICLCKNINEKTIKKIIKDFSCQSIKDVQRYLPVGTCCGKCLKEVKQIIGEKDE